MTEPVHRHPINAHHHDLPAQDTPLVNVHYNGRWIKVPKGLNIIEVARLQGDFLPHYCYHPKLSVSGNCRMCLFEMGLPSNGPGGKPILGADGLPAEIVWLPKPQIGCATGAAEGMGIRTDSPLARESRKGVMEFLLIDHPLDCPICDQAGECKLQQFSSEFGTGQSRFIENKVKKPKNVDLGARIILDDERCILCSRCVRFADEIARDSVLGFVNRGAENTLTCHPGKKFDHPYSLNTVDICPVGALTGKDFRFQMRVWFLKETNSICASCATGCNIVIGTRENRIYRLTPRINEAVNSLWMCDYGRLNFYYLHTENRLRHPAARMGASHLETTWPDILAHIAPPLRSLKEGRLGILASARLTNEELFLVRLLADGLDARLLDIVPRRGEADGFLKSADRNPNSQGARLLNVSNNGAVISEMAQAIENGALKSLLVIDEDAVEAGISETLLLKLDLLIYIGITANSTSNLAHFILPGAGFAEKDGTMINAGGRLQRLCQAIQPPTGARPEWEILRDIRAKTIGGDPKATLETIFDAMASRAQSLQGISLGKISATGIQLEL